MTSETKTMIKDAIGLIIVLAAMLLTLAYWYS